MATRGRRAWELLLTAVFAAAHLSVLLGLRNATPAAASESLADFETATYLDIPPPTAVASPRRVAKPRPVGVSAAVTVPAVQDEVVRPDKAAGFQELTAPSDLKALPPPDPGDAAVDERGLHGTGVVGGVAGGKPPPVIAADLAAETGPRRPALRRRRDRGGSAGRGRVGDRQAATAQPGRDAGPAAPAVPPSRSGSSASRDRPSCSSWSTPTAASSPKSVTLVSSTHPLFGSAAIEVARKARFSAGPDRFRRRDAGGARDGPGSAQVDPGNIEIGRAP